MSYPKGCVLATTLTSSLPSSSSGTAPIAGFSHENRVPLPQQTEVFTATAPCNGMTLVLNE